MKNTLLNIGVVALLLNLTACTKKFDEINTNPTQASAAQFDPNLLLPSSEINYASNIQGYSGALLFQSMWAQILSSSLFPSYYSNGDKYVLGGSYSSYIGSIWNNSYKWGGRDVEIQNLTAAKPELSNLSATSVVMEMFHVELITDVYGDVPFSEAFRAKTDNLTQPKYDAQSTIYPAMLAKLDSVLPLIDASKAKPSNDAIYGGDLTKWKKLGYSLMLRMAMRLTKVDEATAKTYVAKAVAGGVFQSTDDEAIIKFDNPDGYNNGNASAIVVNEDWQEVRWSQPFIAALKTANDPRLTAVAEIPDPTLAQTVVQPGSNTAASQIGMPSGYDQSGGARDISNAPGFPGTVGGNKAGAYSRPRAAVYTDLSTPGFILSYAEIEYLLAEATVRGYITGTTASEYYRNGLVAAMTSLSKINAAATITSGVAEAFAATNTLDVSTTENSLAQINTQYWLATGSMMNFIEAWNNYRRSGYPVLIPVNYPGNFSGGTIPRREVYPFDEASNNPANYAAGSSAMGGDNWTSRMWWDK